MEKKFEVGQKYKTYALIGNERDMSDFVGVYQGFNNEKGHVFIDSSGREHSCWKGVFMKPVQPTTHEQQ